MKVRYTETVEVQKEVEVPDGVFDEYNPNPMFRQIRTIFLAVLEHNRHGLKELERNLYSDGKDYVTNAAHILNDSWEMAVLINTRLKSG